MATETEPRPKFLPAFSWAMYDFANTIFSLAVISRYFNSWIIDERHVPDQNVGLMQFIVGIVLVMTMPALGAIADTLGRRLPFVAVFTAGCVVATAILGGVDSTTWALIVAGIAIFCFQSALSHYDPLLAEVSPPAWRGKISGLGVGIGYIGAFFGLVVLGILVDKGKSQQAFVPTAIMFAVFSLPLFLFVRERGKRNKVGSLVTAVAVANRQLLNTVRSLRQPKYRHIARFLIGRFLYADALSTVIVYMVVFMDRLGGFSDKDQNMVLGSSIAFAAVGAFTAGSVVDKVGPRRVLLAILVLFTTALFVEGGTGAHALVWLLGPVVGIGLGGVWTSDRVFMMRICPRKERGEFFGLYNAVGKLSSGFGPLVVWGGSAWVFHDKLGWSSLSANRVALVGLGLAALIGMLIIRPLSDAPLVDEEVGEAVA